MKFRVVFTFFWGFLLLASNAFAIPAIQHWQTANGTRVYFVPAPELPMVDIEVVFDAGSARDSDKPGLASLTNDLLREGADGYSANKIAKNLDNLGVEVSNWVDRDKATVSLRSLNDTQVLQPALKMLALILSKPDFAKVPFERVRQQMLVTLKYQQQTPQIIARKAFYNTVFAAHPYANLSDGTRKGVKALTRDDVKTFHANYYTAKNALIAIVGALDRKAAEDVAKTIVAQLPNGKTAQDLPSVTELSVAKRLDIVHSSTQTHILVGQPGMAYGDPDYFTLYVGNYFLGGSGLVSKLAEEVREKRGLAYSVRSYFYPKRVAGPFIASLETRNDQAEQALQVMQEVIRNFVVQGLSELELKKVKQGITGSFPLRIAENSDIISYLTMIGFYNLPLDYLHNFNDNVEAVTLEMIKETFPRRLNLDKLVIVTVGKRENEEIPTK